MARVRISAPLWLVLLSLAALIPLIAIIAFTFDLFAQELRRVEHRQAADQARSISADIDREAKALFALAKALATSPSLGDGRLDLFYGEAKQAVRGMDANVLLIGLDKQLLLHTRVPYTSALPKTSAPEAIDAVLASKQSYVSDVFLGRVSGVRVFEVAVPVEIGGKVGYVLTITSDPARFARLLEEQELPPEWNAAVLDRKGAIVAATSPDVAALRRELAPLRSAGSAESAASQSDVTLFGETSLLSQFGSATTGWVSAVWVPYAVLEAPVAQRWRTLIGASVIAIAASALLAYAFSLPFAKLISQTVRACQGIGTGKPLPAIETFLKEGQRIEASLADTNRQLLRRQSEGQEAAKRIAESEQRLRLALSVAKMAIAETPLDPAKPVSVVNEAAVIGMRLNDDPAGRAFEKLLAAVHPADRGRVSENRRRAAAAAGSFVYDFRIVKPDGEIAWIETKGETIAGLDGEPQRIIETNWDITAHKLSEQNLRLITRELTHRAKNLLTVILGIATQTARANVSLDQFLADFSQRIQGLSTCHDLLTRSNWTGASLDELAAAQLAAFGGIDGRRIKAEGPPVLLRNDVVQGLGLAFHELATNAVKYGALSRQKGSVEIAWHVAGAEAGKRLRLTWTERGGPPVRAVKRKGFGHIITVRHLARVLGGEAHVDFHRGGLVWTADAPYDSVVAGPEDMGGA